MSRTVRMVPPDWQHPKDENGKFIPLLDDSFPKRLMEYRERKADWENGIYPDYCSEENKHLTYEEWDGPEPIVDKYMPEFDPALCTHMMMYETTTEGTPISPAFPTAEELAKWLFDNDIPVFAHIMATYEEWLDIIRKGGTIGSMYLENGEMKVGLRGEKHAEKKN